MNKKLSIMLCAVLVLGTISSACVSDDMQAKKKVALSKKSITLKVGKSRKVSVKNTKKAASWKIKSGKKVIQIKKAGKRAVKITAVKKGTARVQCRVGAKKLFCKVKGTKRKETVPVPTPPASVQPAVQSAVPTVTPSVQPSATPVTTPRPTHIPTENFLMKEPVVEVERPLTDAEGHPIWYLTKNISFFGTDILRTDIENIHIESRVAVPSDAIGSFDLSEKKNGSVMSWYTDRDQNGKYEVVIAQEGGVVANPDSSYLFCNIQSVDGFENLYTSNVTDMSSMFEAFNPTEPVQPGNEIPLLDLGDDFDTSKVEKMDSMFMMPGGLCGCNVRLGKGFTVQNVVSAIISFGTNVSRKVIVPNQEVKNFIDDESNYCKLNSALIVEVEE